MGARLIVANVSRLTRDPEFMSKLVEAGVEVEFCDLPRVEGPIGTFMLRVKIPGGITSPVQLRAIGEPDSCEQVGGTGECTVIAAEIERHADVLERRERGNELKALKHEPNFLAAQPRPSIFAEASEVDVVEQHGSCARDVEAGEQAEQGGLAAAGWSDDGDEFAVRDREAHVAQHGDRSIAAGKRFRQLTGNEHVGESGGEVGDARGARGGM